MIPFILAASEHGPMIVNRLDFNNSPGGTYGVGHQILSHQGFDTDEVAFLKLQLQALKLARGGPLQIIDCGANIGVMTLEMAKFIGSNGFVTAYEPQEWIYYALCGNLALNNVFNARAVNAAVGERSRLIDIPVVNMQRPASMGSLELRFRKNVEFIGQNISYAERDLVKVACVAIDDLNLKRLDFLKLDIEGMELEALVGAEKTLLRCHPFVGVEWIKTNRDDLLSWFASRGYFMAKEYNGNFFMVHEDERQQPFYERTDGEFRNQSGTNSN